MEQATEEKTLQIPVSVFESAETKEELEEWLLVHDPAFLEEMRRLKGDADSGKGRPLEELAKKWHIRL